MDIRALSFDTGGTILDWPGSRRWPANPPPGATCTASSTTGGGAR